MGCIEFRGKIIRKIVFSCFLLILIHIGVTGWTVHFNLNFLKVLVDYRSFETLDGNVWHFWSVSSFFNHYFQPVVMWLCVIKEERRALRGNRTLEKLSIGERAWNCILGPGRITLLVSTFAGTKFRGDKLSRSPRAKIDFREYKLSRMDPFPNVVGINFRDGGKLRLNFLIFMRILTFIPLK